MTEKTPQQITIGRGPTNDVILAEPNVSTNHARLTIQSEQMILEDLDSANGTSVGNVENKISRSTVHFTDTVYFGSSEFLISDLISRIDHENPVSSSAPDLQAAAPLVRRNSTAVLFAGICIVATGVAAWLGAADRSNDSTGSVVSDTSRESSPRIEPEKSDLEFTGTDDSSQLDTAGLLPDPKTHTPSLTQDEQISRSLFVVVCQDEKGTTPFQIGTGFAIDEQHIATSAAVIAAMEKLKDTGLTQVVLYSHATKRRLQIASTKIHSRYIEADVVAQNAMKEYDDIVDRIETVEIPVDETEVLQARLDEAQSAALNAMDIKATCDVGIMTVVEPLEHWLTASIASTIRPMMKLTVVGYAHDVQDPFFDSSVPAKVATLPNRLSRLSYSSDGSMHRLQAETATDSGTQFKYAFLGSPVVDNAGRVVAVYSRPTPTRPDSEESQSAITFDAPVFERVVECLVTDG